jgi:hypothetical protein
MVLRWTAARMLNAERSFRRIKGHKQMPQLVAALHRHAHPETVTDTETVGAPDPTMLRQQPASFVALPSGTPAGTHQSIIDLG